MIKKRATMMNEMVDCDDEIENDVFKCHKSGHRTIGCCTMRQARVIVSVIIMVMLSLNVKLGSGLIRAAFLKRRLPLHHHPYTSSNACSRLLSTSSSSSVPVSEDVVRSVPGNFELQQQEQQEENGKIGTNNENNRRPCFRIFYNDVYEVKLPKGHRFPMNKYRQVRELVQQRISQMSENERKLVDCGK